MYELPKRQMVLKCPVWSLLGIMQKTWAAFAALRECGFTGICHCTGVKWVKMRCCLLFSG